MLKCYLLSFSRSQRLSCPRRILDLPSINVPHCQLGNLLRCDRSRSTNPRDEGVPDLDFGLLRKLVEMEGDVDTREEGFIECFDTIGGEEEDTAVVLDVTETKA